MSILRNTILASIGAFQVTKAKAEKIIDARVAHFMGWLQSLGAVKTIRDVRAQAGQARLRLAEKAKRMLKNGRPPHEVIDYLAHTLTNTLLHPPCAQLRQAGYNGRQEVVDAARQLFNLQSNE